MNSEKSVNKYQYVILALCWLAAASVYYSITQLSPLSAILIKQFGVSKASMGLLFSSPLLTLAIFAFMGGSLGDRFGPRIMVSCGISIIACSAFSRGFMSNYTGLLILNLLMGVGIGLTMPNLPKLTAGWFQPAQRGVVTSIYSTGISVGSSLGLMLTLPVIFKIVGSWNKVMFVWGSVSIIIALLVLLFLRNYPDFSGVEFIKTTGNDRIFDSEVYKKKSLWAVAAAFFCACWIYYSYISWIPTIIHAKGASAVVGGTMAGLLPIFGLLANLVAPALSSKVNRRKVFIWGSYLLGIVVTCGLMFAPISAFWVLLPLAGFMLNTPYTISVFLLPLDLFSREKVGAATGMILTIGYFAALLGPFASGKIWDITGSINGVLISLLVVYAIGALIGLFFIPEPLKKGGIGESRQDVLRGIKLR